MERLPFDPANADGAAPIDPSPSQGSPPHEDADGPRHRNPAEAEPITVGRLAHVIRTTLDQRIPSPLRVIGEVSNLRLSARGHWYFSLKDADAVIDCAAWSRYASRFGFQPGDGDEIVVTGSVDFYPPQGRTQFMVTAMKPVGAGELELRFRAMCEELRKLGYFEETHKKPLPSFPRKIAVITSATSAAVRDVVATAAHRCPAVGIVVVDVRVQGDGAAGEVARAVRWVDREHERLGVDAMLVTRGGGSMEDLWAFNERSVAEAVYACELPIVAAIGHESDTTVIELVADLRAATPTQAAMHLVPAAEELRQQVDHLAHRLGSLIRRRQDDGRRHVESLTRHLRQTIGRRIAEERAALERLAGRWAQLQPHALLGDRQRRLAVLEDRLRRGVLVTVTRLRQRIDGIERQLAAVDPREVLARGFSYTTTVDGELLRSAGSVRGGDVIHTHLVDGKITSTVGGAGGAKRRSTRAKADEPEGGLFGEGT